MIGKDDIDKLAKLSRIAVTEEESLSFSHEIDAILGYVSQVQEAGINIEETPSEVKNVFREDSNPHESGVYTDSILKEAPSKIDGYVYVKKILP